MSTNWLDEVQFDNPARERTRRIGQCALLLANAHRWSQNTATAHLNDDMVQQYLKRFNHQRAYWKLTWDEVSRACQEGDVRWAMERQLGGGSNS